MFNGNGKKPLLNAAARALLNLQCVLHCKRRRQMLDLRFRNPLLVPVRLPASRTIPWQESEAQANAVHCSHHAAHSQSPALVESQDVILQLQSTNSVLSQYFATVSFIQELAAGSYMNSVASNHVDQTECGTCFSADLSARPPKGPAEKQRGKILSRTALRSRITWLWMAMSLRLRQDCSPSPSCPVPSAEKPGHGASECAHTDHTRKNACQFACGVCLRMRKIPLTCRSAPRMCRAPLRCR